VIVTPQALEVCLNPASEASPQVNDPPLDYPAACDALTLPWTAPSFAAVKGILHQPGEQPVLKPESRDALLGIVTLLKEEHENSTPRTFSSDSNCLAPHIHRRRPKDSMRSC